MPNAPVPLWSKAFLTALYSLDGVGPATHRKCLLSLAQLGLTEEEFWVNKHAVWQKIGLNEKIEKSIQKFKKEYTNSSYLEFVLAKDIRVVLESEEEYPLFLAQIDNSPPLLFAKGAVPPQSMQPLAVVGTRRITAYGRQVIAELVPPLVHAGKTIVSGFMYGVDVVAQQAALNAGGKTIGVLGFGFDWMYPPRPKHAQLFEQFLEKKATFYTPFAPHVKPIQGNFPARNQIVAGMSEGVLVIEGARNSGSLITAHAAAEMGREVWAVPGSIFSDFSMGTQELINTGAQLVRCAEDVLGVAPSGRRQVDYQALWERLSPQERGVCQQLHWRALTTDQLAEKLQKSIRELSTLLIEMELKGLIEQVGNTWSVKY